MADDSKPYVDPHHEVPAEQWGDIVRAAQFFRAESDESETE